MLSKNQIKLINQLNQKKYRKKYELFIVEGVKAVKEFLSSDYKLETLYTTADILYVPESEMHLIAESELKKISQLKTPQTVLGIFRIPKQPATHPSGISVVLDDVRDPGNMGTIIRLCDWFGIEQIVCSQDCVDCYNPKTVQATMGSLARVSVIYTDLTAYLDQDNRPVYGTFMDGEVIYGQELTQEALIVLGNEGHGISAAVEKLVDHRVAIPRFGKRKATESLNVAAAAAIVLNEFKRLS